MQVKKILCPVDFSDFNQAVNEHASALASAYGAMLVYLHVANPDHPYATFEHVNTEREDHEAHQMLDKIHPTTDVSVDRVVLFGEPQKRIVEYANENNIDLIVIGTHGRTGLKRVLMGSIAEAIVRNADCPVLALKQSTVAPTEA